MNTIEASKIKPCPFCGSNGIPWEISDEHGRIGHRIGCLSAECDIRPYTTTNWATLEDAIEAWNKRSENKSRIAVAEIRDHLAGHQHVDCNRCVLCKIMRICDNAISDSMKDQTP